MKRNVLDFFISNIITSGTLNCSMITYHYCRLPFQMGYIVLIFVPRRRHNVQEIAVKNCEKSKNWRKRLCAPLRTDRWLRHFPKNSIAVQRARNVDVHLYNFFSACRYIALTASVKLRTGIPKMARNEQVCAHKKSWRK